MPVTLAWATDVHLNFVDEAEVKALARRIAEAHPSVLVLTGDIAEAPTLERSLTRLTAGLEVPVGFVLGNHDFYRGAIAAVRQRAATLPTRIPGLTYLSEAPPMTLGPGVALVGVDGWGDARLGACETTGLFLNDFRLIEDLSRLDRRGLLAALRTLGDREAARLAPRLDAAVIGHRRVVVATHVPPFEAACWHEGAISDPDWLPYFTCKAVGDALLRAAETYPHTDFLVLCGHTHSEGEARIRPNLTVLTGAARYGAPTFRLVEV